MHIQFVEILINLITFLLILLLLFTPFYVHKKYTEIGFSGLTHLLFTVITAVAFSGILCVISSYWSLEFSNHLLLYAMDYNSEGMNLEEFVQHVRPEHLDKVQKIEQQMMGIGWPLKALFGFIIFVLPYNLIVILFIKLYRRLLGTI